MNFTKIISIYAASAVALSAAPLVGFVSDADKEELNPEQVSSAVLKATPLLNNPALHERGCSRLSASVAG